MTCCINEWLLCWLSKWPFAKHGAGCDGKGEWHFACQRVRTGWAMSHSRRTSRVHPGYPSSRLAFDSLTILAPGWAVVECVPDRFQCNRWQEGRVVERLIQQPHRRDDGGRQEYHLGQLGRRHPDRQRFA